MFPHGYNQFVNRIMNINKYPTRIPTIFDSFHFCGLDFSNIFVTLDDIFFMLTTPSFTEYNYVMLKNFILKTSNLHPNSLRCNPLIFRYDIDKFCTVKLWGLFFELTIIIETIVKENNKTRTFRI